MEDVIEVSPSGRAKCRGCKEAIPKGELRFGEAYDSAFTGGMALRYWHVPCAAKKLPTQLENALKKYPGEVADRAGIEAAIAAGRKGGKGSAKAPFPHADLAPTGRAKCISCGEGLEKDALRVAVEREIESPSGMPMKTPGYLHPGCAPAWAEEQGQDPGEFVEAVLANSEHLDEKQFAELNSELAG